MLANEVVHNVVMEKLARDEVVASMTIRLVRGVEIAWERGAGGSLPHLEYRAFPVAEANAALNDATMVVVQFESAATVDKGDEIAAVEGVDIVLIGANDILASLGIPGQYEHAKVRDAYARTIAACRKHGKHVGVGGLATRPKLAAEFIAMGARLVSTGTDLQFLLAAAIEKAKQVHEMPM